MDDKLRGLYLVPPHGELIASGEKTSVAKARDCGLEGRWILVSGKLAYGVMELGEPEKVDTEKFDKQYEAHLVDRRDRLRWWPEAEELRLYPVLTFDGYAEPRAAMVPPGVQTKMKEVIFDAREEKDEEAGGMPWTTEDPPDCAKNWTDDEKEKCVKAANAVLEDSGTDKDAIFACIHAAGKGESKETEVKEITVLVDDDQAEDLEVGSKAEWTPAYIKQCVLLAMADIYSDSKAKWTAKYINNLPDSSFLYIESGGEKDEDGKTVPRSLRHLPVKDVDGKPDIPHVQNAIARAPQMKDKEGKPFSDSLVKRLQNKAREMLEESKKARGEGQGTDGERQGDGGADYCYCEDCEQLFKHERGKPCNEIKCPECGEPLHGATEVEVEAVGTETARALTAAVATGTGQQIKEAETDDKAGRRVRRDKVTVLSRGKKELDDLVKAFGELLGWAQYDDNEKPATSDDEQASAAKSLAKIFGSSDTSAAFAFKAKDGNLWWFQWTTNAFQDREGEIFTTKAIEDYVERHDGDDMKGEFWFWHIPGTKFADVKWQATVGRFLAQAGPFDDSPIGREFKEFFSAYPDGHPEIAPEGWGASHKYYYDAKDREDRVYEKFEIGESTVLPRSVASNPWNPIPRTMEVQQMNESQKAALQAIGGDELVQIVTAEGEQRTKDLEGQVAFKGETETEPAEKESVEKEPVEKEPVEAKTEPAEGEGEGKTETETAEEEAGEKDAPDRAEIASALTAVVETLRDEIKAASKETTQAVTAQVAQALEPLVAEVKELRKDDVQKVAEKAAETPAASLSDLMASVIGRKEAEVKPDEKLAGMGPKETEAKAQPVTGIPFVDTFIAGADQAQQ